MRVGRRLLMSTCAWLRYTHPCAFSTQRWGATHSRKCSCRVVCCVSATLTHNILCCRYLLMVLAVDSVLLCHPHLGKVLAVYCYVMNSDMLDRFTSWQVDSEHHMLWMFRWHFQCVYNVLVPPHTDALTWPCRMLHQNHYEVLGLEKTCSPADIREQFIRLSKEVCGASVQELMLTLIM